MKKALCFFSLIFFYQIVYSQAPVIEWQNTIGGSFHDQLYAISITSDGGYICGGWSGSDISGDKSENNRDSTLSTEDYWIIKLDGTGNIQWQKTIGGNNTDDLRSISQTFDGGYICGGYSKSGAAAYVELFFIMTSLWMDQFYYVFGFTLIVYLILIITCAEATVLLVYYQLCAENHRWWWFSFFASGSTAFYTFLYSIFWFRTLHASRLMTYLLYFGYMFLISFSMLLVFGTIGALTSLWFVCKIFSTVKVD